MRSLTTEWIEKAEEHWNVLLKAYRARKNPAYNAACFHAQQCAERYLKGRLEEAGIAFAKTHDLDQLLQQAQAIEPTWSTLQPELNFLNDFSVLYRYPGSSASKATAKRAMDACRKVRRAIRASLRLKSDGTQSFEPIAAYDAAQNKIVAVPLDLGPAGDQVILLLFGTSIRFRSSPTAINVRIGGVAAELLYAGAAPGFVGLDQVNLAIPRSLAGRGEVDISLTADGRNANAVKLAIR